jgi:HEAT repeat protein
LLAANPVASSPSSAKNTTNNFFLLSAQEKEVLRNQFWSNLGSKGYVLANLRALQNLKLAAERLQASINSDDTVVSLGQSPVWIVKTMQAMDSSPDRFVYLAFSGKWFELAGQDSAFVPYFKKDTNQPNSLQKVTYRQYLRELKLDPESIVSKKGKTVIVEYKISGVSLKSFLSFLSEWAKELNIDIQGKVELKIFVEDVNINIMFRPGETMFGFPTRYLEVESKLIDGLSVSDRYDDRLVTKYPFKEWTDINPQEFIFSENARLVHFCILEYLAYYYPDLIKTADLISATNNKPAAFSVPAAFPAASSPAKPNAVDSMMAEERKIELKKFILEGNLRIKTLNEHDAKNFAFLLDMGMTEAGVKLGSVSQFEVLVRNSYDRHNVRWYAVPVVGLVYFQDKDSANKSVFMLLNDSGEIIGYGVSSRSEGVVNFRYQIFEAFRGDGLGDAALKVILYALYKEAGEDKVSSFHFKNYFRNRESFDPQSVLPGYLLSRGFVESPVDDGFYNYSFDMESAAPAASPAASSPVEEKDISAQELDAYSSSFKNRKESRVNSSRMIYLWASTLDKHLSDVDTLYTVRVGTGEKSFTAYRTGENGLFIIKGLKANERIITEGILECIGLALYAQTPDGPIYGVGHLLATGGAIDLLPYKFSDLISSLPVDARQLKITIYSNDNGAESRKMAEIEKFKTALKEKFPSVSIVDKNYKGIVRGTQMMVTAHGWVIDRHSLTDYQRDVVLGNWLESKSETSAASSPVAQQPDIEKVSRQFMSGLFNLENILNGPARYIRLATANALGLVYQALIRKEQEFSLSQLESKLNDSDLDVRFAAANALGLVYQAMVEKGKMTLSQLENKLNISNYDLRIAAINALGLVYQALIRRGQEVSLFQLESELNNPVWRVRLAAVNALGLVNQAMVEKGKMTLSQLESQLNGPDRDIHHAIANALVPVYQAMVEKGKMTLSQLESKLNDSDDTVRLATANALGPVYQAMVEKGKMTLSQLENKLNDPDRYIRLATANALGLVYQAMVEKGKVLDEDYNKYRLWIEGNLPYQGALFKEYLATSDAQGFILSLKRRIENMINSGFDYNEAEELKLVYLTLKTKGIDVTYEEFKQRISKIAKFDAKYPGHFKGLFTKAANPRIIELSSHGARLLDASHVNLQVFRQNLDELQKTRLRIDSLKWMNEDFPENRVFNLRNFYYLFRLQQDQKAGILKEGERFRCDFPSEEAIEKEFLANKKAFYKVVFLLAKDRIGDKLIGEQCLHLLRDLIISDIMTDEGLLREMRSTDTERMIAAFKNFYEDYKSHLPNSLGLGVSKIKGLEKCFEDFSSKVYAEISKVKFVRQTGAESYRLVEQGFLSIFRGRAGIVDCSFDIDSKGDAYTRALHEDTMYLYVYKGKELKGYIGLMLGQTQDKEKILTIDTINSPSLDGEELLGNLFTALDDLAKELGCIGVALPANISSSFNFHNKNTICEMKIYEKSKPVFVTPLHQESWSYFTDIFGRDECNSIEKGRFVLLDLGRNSKGAPAASSPASSNLIKLRNRIEGLGGKIQIVELRSFKNYSLDYYNKIIELNLSNFFKKSQELERYQDLRAEMLLFVNALLSNVGVIDRGNIAFAIKESIQNAFVHGNKVNPNYPIFIRLNINEDNQLLSAEIYNALLDESDAKALEKARKANLFGFGEGEKGIKEVAGFKREEFKDETGRVIGTRVILAPFDIQKERVRGASSIADKGGIDFRALPIVTQAMSNLKPMFRSSFFWGQSLVNLNKEWQDIEQMASSGITPSSDRIKEYLQASCAKGSILGDKDKVILCIADILRSEEENCCLTDPALRDILVVLETANSSVELSRIFLG